MSGPELHRRMKGAWGVIAGALGKWTKEASERRQFAMASDAFARLDASTVRDLGMSRSEFGSYWAEAHGLAEQTRVRVVPE